ncbi:MAG: aromatic-ring-hydroxylating dioxygenase subunit beta [Rhodospirillaceae bacterium]|jgi:3-phenylpropionate/cinnamic acid dioxygenase small subunit|nr:aromatic-ring-hydroxylating dioxygenase subunit beta [Rhodospirillaceae bacterium]MBT5457571.1 aromatic-ring-hydroxylating dioxygenase subunit beta [Rhodospirillaceae bacterium]
MTTGPVSDVEFLRIQRFLHDEAALLDARDYEAWLDLLTDDIVYRVTTQVVRRSEDGAQRTAIIDERADSLRLRVEQLADTALTHAENPPTLTRRFLSNFRMSQDDGGDYQVEMNLMVHINRGTVPDGSVYVGQRRDVLRRNGDGFQIADRQVDLDQSVLTNSTLSTIL